MKQLGKKPSVSIIIPVFNDEQYIEQAITSCLRQTLENIEVVCVDDKSTDSTPEIIKKIAKTDARVRLVQHEKNMSALQARYTGIKNAQADYILFLDGDDELRIDAAEITYNKAVENGSDLVGFGIKIFTKTARLYGFENNIQPSHKELIGEDIIKNIFPPGKPAQGQLVRFMYQKGLLEKAYRNIPNDKIFHRAEDKLISFQVASFAKKYTSTQSKLYTYFIYRGGSDYDSIDLDKFNHYASAIDTLDFLGDIAKKSLSESQVVMDSYVNARLATIAVVIKRLKSVNQKYRQQAADSVLKKVSAFDFISAIATFNPDLLELAKDHLTPTGTEKKSRNIGLYMPDLSTKKMQDLAIEQSQHLRSAGYNTTLITRSSDNLKPALLKRIDIDLEYGDIEYQKLSSVAKILQDKDIDTLIDHDTYNTHWPFRRILAKTFGIKTIVWTHHYSLQPVSDLSDIGQFMLQNIDLVDELVVPSSLDVTFWKSLGYNNVQTMPYAQPQALIDHIKSNPILYKKYSMEHLASTMEPSNYNLPQLYQQLLSNSLSSEFSPKQDNALMGLFLEQTLDFARDARLKNEKQAKECAQKQNEMERLVSETASKADLLDKKLSTIESSRKNKFTDTLRRMWRSIGS